MQLLTGPMKRKHQNCWTEPMSKHKQCHSGWIFHSDKMESWCSHIKYNHLNSIWAPNAITSGGWAMKKKKKFGQDTSTSFPSKRATGSLQTLPRVRPCVNCLHCLMQTNSADKTKRWFSTANCRKDAFWSSRHFNTMWFSAALMPKVVIQSGANEITV